MVFHTDYRVPHVRPGRNGIGRRALGGSHGRQAHSGRRILCRDRAASNHYFNVVFFDSYESAMQNSKLPETQRFSQEMMSIADGAPTFYDLDIIDDRS